MITVFTPTYNRGYILQRAYESLLCQTFKDFIWVIMDDGSSDNTKTLIEKWINDNRITIDYHFQENQGRFAAYNNARQFFAGELVAFLDSDDIYLPNCLERVVDLWEKENHNDIYGGILALMNTPDGEIVGTRFPTGLKSEKIYALYDKHKLKGDKLIVLRTDLAVKHMYPIFEGEKFGGDSIVFNKISDSNAMLLLDEPLAIREYLPDSITNNLLKHHILSKNGMREHYLDCLKHERADKIRIIKHYIGLIAFSCLTGYSFMDIQKISPNRALSALLYPAGYLYYIKLSNVEAHLQALGRYRK